MRAKGFRDAAARLGMTVIDGLSNAPGESSDLLPSERSALTSPSPATAFACWTDDSARWTCEALTRTGHRIPEDVAVIGFNGINLAYTPLWAPTTIRAPWREVGATAVRLLLHLVDGEAARSERLPVHLINGSTT
jgi:DNA-binding LacI/PurR family transcriptional regulator